MKITVGLAQISPKLADVRSNCETHMMFVDRAAREKVDLLIFPELSLTGYMLQDAMAHTAHKAVPSDPLMHSMLEASQRLDLVAGFAEVDERGRYFTSGAYLSRGQIVHVHRKVYLPTYGMFDEGRFFDAGDSIRAFDTRFGRMAILICEDFWHLSPPYLAWLDGADVLLLTSASPGRGLSDDDRLSSARFVETVNKSYAAIFGNYVIHSNRVGFEDGQNFWGGSTIFNPDGDLVVQAPYFEEALTVAEIDLAQIRRSRARTPLLRDERPELTLRELQRIIGHSSI